MNTIMLIIMMFFSFDDGSTIQECMGGPWVPVSGHCLVYGVDSPYPYNDVDLKDFSMIQNIIQSPDDGVVEGRIWKLPNIPATGSAIIISLDGSYIIEQLDDNGAFSCEVPLGWIGFYRHYNIGDN